MQGCTVQSIKSDLNSMTIIGSDKHRHDATLQRNVPVINSEGLKNSDEL